MSQNEFADQLRIELNIASTEYIKARAAFAEALNEIRRLQPADAGILLRLAVEEHNRAFEFHRRAAHRYADFCRAGRDSWSDRPTLIRAEESEVE